MVATGASFTAVMLMVAVSLPLAPSPSSTVNKTERAAVEGLSELSA